MMVRDNTPGISRGDVESAEGAEKMISVFSFSGVLRVSA
jgi:hypothetical protein